MDVPMDESENHIDSMNPNWFLVGLMLSFSALSILCYLEAESFRSSFEADPVPRTGKEMRLVFLRVLLACCITRAIAIGVEIPLWMYGSCPSSWGCALVHTAPNLPFLTAFSLLALFWAQLAMSITNQHQATLAPLFKKWNVVLYALYALLVLCASLGILHRARFIKATVLLFGVWYLMSLVIVVYYGAATLYAFKEESPKRNSPAESPKISYRQLSSQDSITAPNRSQNKSPVQLITSSASSTGSNTPPLLSPDNLALNEKRTRTLHKLMCLCLFGGLLLLVNSIFFLGSFLDINLSFRKLHKDETVVAIEYLCFELIPSALIMLILGSWKQRRSSAGITLTIPMTIHNNMGYGTISRDSSYGDLKSNSRNSAVRGGGGGGGGGTLPTNHERSGRMTNENAGNALGNYRNGYRDAPNNGGSGRNPLSNYGGGMRSYHGMGAGVRGPPNDVKIPTPVHPGHGPQLVAPQPIQPIARRAGEQGTAPPTLHHPQPVAPKAK